MLERYAHCGVAVKRYVARYHFIHCNTDRIDITLLIHHASARLLRRRIMHRTHYARADRLCGRRRAGNAEICHFNFAIFGNDNILGFNIPVYDMLVMGSLKSGHHLDRDADRLFRR